MDAKTASLLTLLPLLIIAITALYGMNDVRTHRLRHLVSPQGYVETALGLSFLATFSGAGLMIFGIIGGLATGVGLYSWLGLVFTTGIAGVFLFAAVFMPWKQWVRSLPDRRAAAEAKRLAREASAA